MRVFSSKCSELIKSSAKHFSSGPQYSKNPHFRFGRSPHKPKASLRSNRGSMAGGTQATDTPWWTRWTRWRQTSQAEASAAEQGLLSLLKVPLAVHNVRVGPGPQDFLHTVLGGGAALPPSAPTVPQASTPRACFTSRSPSAPDSTAQASPAAAAANLPVAPAGSQVQQAPPLVLMPGYGAGTGFFFKNLEGLSSTFRLYAVDWLGTALSGRPDYQAKSREQSESFFLDSLKKWKQQVGLGAEPVILVGHSLGGYLAACYALAHPEDVKHLVLVCPAGVPQAPEDWQRNVLGSSSGWRSQAFRAAMWAWEAGMTPHALVRTLGPWGPGLCEKYVVNRFSHHGDTMSSTEINWFKQYFYHSVAAPGSGEYALRHLLAPGAWAHEPLTNRLQELKVPVTFIYGKEDWMRPQHAVDLVEKLKQQRQPRVAGDLHVEVVDDSGHFVFMDRPDTFNAALKHAVRAHLANPPPQPAPGAVTHTAHTSTWAVQDTPGSPHTPGNYIAARRHLGPSHSAAHAAAAAPAPTAAAAAGPGPATSSS
ncbi:hypothetical protein QJQ45_023374 [Haematococcus lacustris]|nr:hypothetical protein QJQ45_023374 [Haematococcus lacustris]